MVKDFTLLSKALKPLPLPKTDSEGNTLMNSTIQNYATGNGMPI